MSRAILRSVAALVLLAAPVAAEAQSEARLSRIAILTPGPMAPRLHLFEAFRQGLRDLGYADRDIAIELRSAEGVPARLPDLAAELVRMNVDVIVAATTPAIMAAKQATSTIPIVMVSVGDPVGSGLVASLARPGGNLTGVSILSPDLSGKRLELLRELVPGLSRVAIIVNPSNPVGVPQRKEMQVAAPVLGLELQRLEARGASDLEAAFRAAKTRANAVIALDDPVIFSHVPLIADLAAKTGLPTISGFTEYPRAGGLLAYGIHTVDLYRRVATYVDKIVKGAKPADLPVEQPMRFELVINLKTAKTLGLTIPRSVLVRADELIQ